jgi:hypothetical protein
VGGVGLDSCFSRRQEEETNWQVHNKTVLENKVYCSLYQKYLLPLFKTGPTDRPVTKAPGHIGLI